MGWLRGRDERGHNPQHSLQDAEHPEGKRLKEGHKLQKNNPLAPRAPSGRLPMATPAMNRAPKTNASPPKIRNSGVQTSRLIGWLAMEMAVRFRRMSMDVTATEYVKACARGIGTPHDDDRGGGALGA